MRGYFLTAGLCFTLGASTLLYSGVIDDIEVISQALTENNEQAMQIELKFANEQLAQLKLDTELKTLSTEIQKRKLSIELETLDNQEDLRKEALKIEQANALLALKTEQANAKEWAWWQNFIKIFWLLALAVGLPSILVMFILLRIFVNTLGQGGDYAEAE